MKFNILNEGPVGTGKTTSLRTIVEDCDRQLFVVATEPGIETTLGAQSKGGPLPEDKCKWVYITPANVEWRTLQENAKAVSIATPGDLQKMPAVHKNKFTQFIQLLSALSNFTDDRTGEEFGPVDSFPEEYVLAIDGLSGVSQMALMLTAGAKPIITQPEWGVAMNMVLHLIRKLCYDTKCTFILNAHVERQLDPTFGGSHVTLSTLGNKLAPELVKPFDEIFYSYKRSGEFFWSTIEPGVDLKTRTLEWRDDYAPTYQHFFKD